MKSSYIKTLVLYLAWLCLPGISLASGDPVVKLNLLDGSQDQIQPDSSVTVADNSLIGTSFTAVNKVSLAIDETSLVLPQGPFTASVTLHIDAWLAGSEADYDTTLTISYDTNKVYVQEHAFYFKDAYQVTVTVTSVHTSAGWDVWQLLRVYNEISSTIAYDFSCTVNSIDEIDWESLPADTDKDELAVSWPNSTGADEYDLEWTYVDSIALASGLYGSPGSPSPALLFNQNASRVTITASSYKIPLIYDNVGYLFFRVRAAQLTVSGGRYEANWSNQSSALGKFKFNGHERRLNWQATTSFAEEGKRKTVVQYFDGSLRSRQTVTKDNTTDTTIIAESFYDQQGRPVIQVLPAPSLQNIIRYSQDFNTGINGSEYTVDQYDKIFPGQSYCRPGADSMSSISGAAQYYSPANPLKDQDEHRFIPDAKGFPFSEVQYTPDNTGRISRQGGVGPVHQLGRGHETVYYYGTPSQEELDALFGTDVGYSSHYYKTMVKDANGQLSVSYTDMRGRTIATALAGVPSAATMDTLSSYRRDTITETLADSGSVVIKDLVMESKKTLLVSLPGQHIFNYELSPQQLALEGCSENICYDCLYDLRITISGGCDNESFGGQPFDTLVTNFSIGEADGLCNGEGFSFSFSKVLGEGSYEITKQLSLSREGNDYYRDSIFLAANNCTSLEEFVQEQRILLAANLDCVPDCAGCRAAIGDWDDFRNSFLEQAGIETDTAAYRGQALAAYQKALEACDDLCDDNLSDYNDIRSAMLADMSAPSGQYANIDSTHDVYSIFYSAVGTDPDSTAIYTRVTNYRDEQGNPDLVLDESTGLMVNPSRLSPRAFARKFKPTWAAALLPFHPEYCKLQQYEQLKAAAQWARRFEKVERYQEALQMGYLNPVNGTTAPFTDYDWGGGPHPDPDPLRSVTGYASLDDSLVQYRVLASNDVSMWGAATAMVRCEEDAPQNCYFIHVVTPFGPELCEGDLDMAWRVFRQLYLESRRSLITSKVSTCFGGVEAATLLAAYHQPHFADAEDLMMHNGLNLPSNQQQAGQYEQQMQGRVDDFYQSTCDAYEAQWRRELEGCYSPGDLDEIIDRMKAVCRAGSDVSHPFGSSTVAPSSTHPDRSFQDVLDGFTAIGENCSADKISAPLPYDRQLIYSNKPLWTKPDSCECSNITALHNDYLADSLSYGSFSAYLDQQLQTTMTDSVLNILLGMCEESSPECNYLPSPILLPAAMQCYSGSVCADCEQVDSVYTSFRIKYPSIIPVNIPADSSQRADNVLFENFMNSKLGFSKRADDYLRFMGSCESGVDSLSSPLADSLQVWLNEYKNTYFYTSSEHVDLPMRTLAGSKTPKAGPKGVFNVDKKFVGRTVDGTAQQVDSSFAAVWNSDSTNQTFGTLSVLPDGNFRLLLNAGKSAPKNGIIGMRYFQFEIPSDTLDGLYISVRSYIDFGDSTFAYSSRLESNDRTIVLNTGAPIGFQKPYCENLTPHNASHIRHFYTSEAERTVTVYHSDNVGVVYFDCITGNCADIRTLKNLRGYFPEKIVSFANHSTQDSTFNRTSEIRNFNEITTIEHVDFANGHTIGDRSGKDFLNNRWESFENNHNMQAIRLDNSHVVPASEMRKVSEYLPNIPQNFPNLNIIEIRPYDSIFAGDVDFRIPRLKYIGLFNSSSITSSQIDRVLHQVATTSELDSGRFLIYGDFAAGRTAASDQDIDALISRGWYIRIGNTVINNITTPLFPQGIPEPDSIPSASEFSDFISNKLDSSLSLYKVLNLYRDYLGIHLDYYSLSNLNRSLLCGNATPVFPPVDINALTNCSDSSFMIYSNATELYHEHTDSLKSTFDRSYRAQCLQAYKAERFTVSRVTGEYHYTLYYYDQAGNLVRTVSPKGVQPNYDSVWLSEVRASRASGDAQTPDHSLTTEYRYNTLNQVVAQQTPDGGLSEYWYDRLGRLALSRNAKQKAVNGTAANRLYSYTIYDAQGRITEVGQVRDNTGAVTVDAALTRNPASLESWLDARKNYRGQITRTVYDLAYEGFTGIDSRLLTQQRNLRNRVSYTLYIDTAQEGTAYSHGSFYSYDVHGNVDTLLQDYGVAMNFPNVMNSNGNRFKKIAYRYDLISGKTIQVSYQAGFADQLLHRYSYDAENRLTIAETSTDGRRWEQEATYRYYRHGPLSRQVLGHQQVQGIDYAYTLHGWLKGLNSTMMHEDTEMGGDGLTGGVHQYTARDVLGLNLNYYDTADYSAIGSGANPFPGTQGHMPAANYRPLFNGNISSMAVHTRAAGESLRVKGPLLLHSYHYDQLNRLTRMDTYNKSSLGGYSWTGLTGMNEYKEMISYDGNGNILTYRRQAHKLAYIMDLLNYHYTGNQLQWISDVTPSSRYDGTEAGDVADIDNQSPGNYGYDEIGNLIKDNAEGITGIDWNVYGKIRQIRRTASSGNPVSQIDYHYDAQGNRVGKTVLLNTGLRKSTWYVRDGQGNILSTYSSSGSGEDVSQWPLWLTERNLYGSSRLGVLTQAVKVDGGPAEMADSNGVHYYRGYRQYELSNHLGNVLATISDRKWGVDEGSDGGIDYYEADVRSLQNYYSFGMLMPGRMAYRGEDGLWTAGAVGSGGTGEEGEGITADLQVSSRSGNTPAEYRASNSVELLPGFESDAGDEFLVYISEGEGGSGGGSGSSLNGYYRYGFNGKENDNEVKGTGNQQDYGMRIYDPRLGRFLSVDPLTKGFAMLTPYQYASNSPLSHIDLDGKEGLWYIYARSGVYGPTVAKIVNGTSDGIEASVTNTWNFLASDMWKGETWKQTGLFLEEAALGMSTVKVYETPRVDAAVKRFEDNVINGDAYSRSKYISEFSTDVITGYLSSKGLGNIKSFVANTVKTDWAIAKQSMSVGALSAAAKTKSGATLYRIGTTGVSAEGKAAQFWSLENPLLDPEGYAKKYNVPLKNIKDANFIETAKLKKGSNFITREAGDAPGSANSGKGIEVVIDKGGTTDNIINPIKKE